MEYDNVLVPGVINDPSKDGGGGRGLLPETLKEDLNQQPLQSSAFHISSTPLSKIKHM